MLQVWVERWGVRFLCLQGLPSVKICVFPPASRLPTTSSQEAQIQDYEGKGFPLAYL